jgi:hypothetical protein
MPWIVDNFGIQGSCASGLIRLCLLGSTASILRGRALFGGQPVWKEPRCISNAGIDRQGKTMNTQKLRRPVLLTAAALAALILGACGGGTDAPNTTSTPTTSSSPAISPEVANPGEAAVQKLLGKWDGPEGTYLSVNEKMGADGKQQLPRKFEVEIKDLDKAEKFEGTAKDGTIEFTRKGKTESVKAATGTETGMKGFEKETNCVVVTKGSEGFCKKADASKAPASSPASSPVASPAASNKR